MAVASNPTSANNAGWMDSFWGGISSIAGSAGSVWLEYRTARDKAELDKLQAQNTALLGKEQLAIYEAQQQKANMLLWGVMIFAGILAIVVVKKMLKRK